MVKQIHVVNINEDTGEVYSEKTKNIKSKLWVDGKGAMIKCRNYHVTLYQDMKLSDYIKDRGDLFKAYLLIEHIYKDTNIIYTQNDGRSPRPATLKDISEIIGVCEKRTKTYLNKMIGIGLIGEIKLKIKDIEYTTYAFNPVFVNSCKYIDDTLYLLFKPYVDKHCPAWIREKYEALNREANI